MAYKLPGYVKKAQKARKTVNKVVKGKKAKAVRVTTKKKK